jgi:tetratricopeptide (TPR) repeat protein
MQIAVETDVFGGHSVAYGLLNGTWLPPRTGVLSRFGAGSCWRILRHFSMRTRVLTVLLLLGATAAPIAADARSDAKKQVEFGITVAQRGLWREAIYRWERAAQIDPKYAEAYNDLAIAYEHEGDLEKARVAYEKALEIEPNNALIKQNYELFKEINDRTTRKDTQDDPGNQNP